MDLSGSLTYVGALSVATERVTEFLKRFPGVSILLSTKRTGAMEDVRVMCVHVLAVGVAMVSYLFCQVIRSLSVVST